jgi:hypothetical protein
VDDHVDSSKSLGEARTAAEISDCVLDAILAGPGLTAQHPHRAAALVKALDDLTSEVAGTAGDQNHLQFV